MGSLIGLFFVAPDGLDSEFTELLAQRVAIDPEQLGRTKLIAARPLQDLYEKRTLKGREEMGIYLAVSILLQALQLCRDPLIKCPIEG